MFLSQLANRFSRRVSAADHLEQFHLGSPFHLGQDGKLAIARCLSGPNQTIKWGQMKPSNSAAVTRRVGVVRRERLVIPRRVAAGVLLGAAAL